MFTKKYFGTDGIRGKVGESLINPEFVLKLGWAAGMVLKSKQGEENNKVLIGKDTRISGYLLESVLEAGLTSAGMNAHMLGPMPTPGIAYLTRTLRASAGIVISASHNPYYDNGIKFFSSDGTKISDELEAEIEKQLTIPMQIVSADRLGKAERVTDALGRYVEFCKSTLGLNSRLNGMKIVVDCANGATYHAAPCVLQELGAKIIKLGSNPDGFNINDQCGSTHPHSLAATVRAEKADVGIALDGDGDRVIMVDHKGEVVDGDELLFILTKYYKDNNTLKGGVIGTSMSNLGLELALKKLKVEFARTKVGDRYVLQALREHGWYLGGESSGHIVNLNLTTTGDGIISALQVLTKIHQSGKSLSELKSSMTKFPQILLNIRFDKSSSIYDDPKIKEEVEKIEKHLGNKGRVLLRTSGTEPVIRIMVEGEDYDLIKTLAEELAAQVKKIIAK